MFKKTPIAEYRVNQTCDQTSHSSGDYNHRCINMMDALIYPIKYISLGNICLLKKSIIKEIAPPIQQETANKWNPFNHFSPFAFNLLISITCYH